METSITQKERNWAAAAHASAAITFLISISTGGFLTLLGLLIPLGIYYFAPNKSQHVQKQALHALGFQIAAIIGLIAALIVGVMLLVLAWLITGVLSLVVVGLLLIPVAILLTIAFVVIYGAAPFLMTVYGCWGALKVYRGEDFEYAYVSNWVNEWMDSNRVSSEPVIVA